jgi:hypothetical protein
MSLELQQTFKINQQIEIIESVRLHTVLSFFPSSLTYSMMH